MGKVIEIYEEELEEAMMSARSGICRECENRQDGCEPDARNYKCEACGKPEVFGVEELLISGNLSIKD